MDGFHASLSCNSQRSQIIALFKICFNKIFVFIITYYKIFLTQSINNKDIFLREMTILTPGPDTQGCSRTGVALCSFHIVLLYNVIFKRYHWTKWIGCSNKKKQCSHCLILTTLNTQCNPLILTNTKYVYNFKYHEIFNYSISLELD